ncbi:MAG: DUF4214 domain-containing protein [Clostridiales bacterium]|nr:DUF4214 domain-containing protein [Clostridiales bacterium]
MILKKYLACILSTAFILPASLGMLKEPLRADSTSDEKIETQTFDSSEIAVDYALEDSELSVSYKIFTPETVQAIYDTCMSFGKAVDISSYNIPWPGNAEIWEDLQSIRSDFPELFYVDYFSISGGSTVNSILIEYSCTESQRDTMMNSINAEAAKALSQIDSNMTDWQKVLVLHDWLADHITYGSRDHAYDIYGAFVLGTCVCEGYAKAFTYLARRVGIQSYFASSAAMSHAWNVVLVDGKYYNVDVTWDDPTADLLGRVEHSYLLLDNESMKKVDGSHLAADNIDPNLLTNKDFTSAKWKGVSSIISYYKGEWFFSRWTGSSSYTTLICKSSNILTNAGSTIVSLPAEKGRWNVDTYSFITSSFARPERYNHYLIYNTNSTIEYIDLDSSDYAPQVMYDTSEIPYLSPSAYVWLYEFTVEGDELHYCVYYERAESRSIQVLPNILSQTDPEPDPDPIIPDPVKPDPVNPDPVNPDPVNPDPVNPDPTNPDPTNPDPTNPDPTNPEPTTPSPEPAKDASFEEFVERLYTVALGRASEADGKAYWVEQVVKNGFTGADCARFFLLDAPEFMNRKLPDDQFVEVLYQTFFGRASEADGKAYWLGRLSSGASKADLVNDFIESTEWCNICATYGVKSGAVYHKATVASKNAVKFATRLYTCCLGRDPEEEGLSYWSLALTNLDATGYQAASLFFTLPEFVGLKTTNEEYLRRLYTTFMGRDPEADGFAYWLGLLNGGTDRNDVMKAFAGCPEFQEICNSYGIVRGDI